MQQNYLIDFRGPALTLEQVADKAAYVEATLERLRINNARKSNIAILCSIFLYVALAGYIMVSSKTINIDAILLGIGTPLLPFVAILMASMKMRVVTIGHASKVFGDRKIFCSLWILTATKQELLESSTSLDTLNFLNEVMAHPAGSAFSGYIRGVLQQRHITAYEEHLLKREFWRLEKDFDHANVLERAETLRRQLAQG